MKTHWPREKYYYVVQEWYAVNWVDHEIVYSRREARELLKYLKGSRHNPYNYRIVRYVRDYNWGEE